MTSQLVSLGELALAHYGKALKDSDRSGLGQQEVFGSSGLIGFHDHSLVQYPTIVIGRKGSVGSITFAPNGGWPIDTAFFLELRDPERVDIRYLYWALNSAGLDRRAITTSIPGLNREELYRTKLRLPAIFEQRRIVAILDKMRSVRRKRQDSLKLIEQLSHSAFLELFGDSAMNRKRWEAAPLGELAVIRRGASPRPIHQFLGGTVPWIKIGDATKSERLYITRTEEHVSAEGAAKSVLLDPGSIVIANSGVSLGFARILSIRGCIHDGWLSVENLDDRIEKLYFVSLINTMTAKLRATAPSGTQPNLNTTIARSLQIPVPPRAIQKRFAKIVEACQDTSDNLRAASRVADDLSYALQQSAFGEVGSLM